MSSPSQSLACRFKVAWFIDESVRSVLYYDEYENVNTSICMYCTAIRVWESPCNPPAGWEVELTRSFPPALLYKASNWSHEL